MRGGLSPASRATCYDLLVHTLVAASVLFLAVACGPESAGDAKKGTISNPVEVCERFGDVCRIDGARLGVCNRAQTPSGWSCMSQH